jgi:hypothetical protein
MASAGWTRYDRDTYVHWKTPHRPPAADENVTVRYRLDLYTFLDARQRAIEVAVEAHRAWLVRLAHARQEAAARRAALARQTLQAPPHQAQADPGSGGGGGGGFGGFGGSLHGMVCSFAWSCAIASCVVGRESGWNPRAVNPRSGSAGLFQLMPFWWRGKFDPFNPYLNARFAYGLYRQSGWSPWAGGHYGCGF